MCDKTMQQAKFSRLAHVGKTIQKDCVCVCVCVCLGVRVSMCQ